MGILVMMDTFTLAGARTLRDKIQEYWATRTDEFYEPHVYVEPSIGNVRRGGTGYLVRSDMVNGQPRRKQFFGVQH